MASAQGKDKLPLGKMNSRIWTEEGEAPLEQREEHI